VFELYPLVMVSKTRSGLLILRLIKVILILSGSVKPSLQPLCTTSLSGSETLLNEKPCAPIASIRLQPSTTSRAKPDVEKLIASSIVVNSTISLDVSTVFFIRSKTLSGDWQSK